MLQSSQISSFACVVLKSPSGADIPFPSSSGPSWFVGAALDVTPWDSPVVHQGRQDCEASGCSERGFGMRTGRIGPYGDLVLSLALLYRDHMFPGICLLFFVF